MDFFLDFLAVSLLVLAAYLMGSIPTAYLIVGLVKGIDIRSEGTGNVGALNAFHQLGPGGGLLVLAVDAGKGALAVLAPQWLGAPDWTIFLTAPLVLAGHNWPAWLGFRGGKGAAVIFGLSLAVLPQLTLITLAFVAAILVFYRNVVWATLAGFVALNALLVITDQGTDQIALCAALTLLVTGTYLVSIRKHIGHSVRGRQWRELITGIA